MISCLCCAGLACHIIVGAMGKKKTSDVEEPETGTAGNADKVAPTEGKEKGLASELADLSDPEVEWAEGTCPSCQQRFGEQDKDLVRFHCFTLCTMGFGVLTIGFPNSLDFFPPDRTLLQTTHSSSLVPRQTSSHCAPSASTVSVVRSRK